jgi:opacity protein-like surface antigen
LVYDGADTTNSTTGSVTDKSSSWAMQLGAEYHLKGSDKMSPYFMAGINFGGMSEKTIGADVDTSDDYLKGDGYTDKSSSSMFGIGLGAGMDYYIADNLYLGLELGWNWTKMTDRGSSFEVTGANPSETTFPSAGNSSGMGIGAMNTAFRIGWRF